MFYRRHYELVAKFKVGLKSLIGTRILWGLEKNVNRTDFFYQFRKVIMRYRRIGYNIVCMLSYLPNHG